jgi:LmbE family N-acetylglucosaminyl deacetylase
LTGLLVREIVSDRPDLILGPGDDGAYGNRDHMAVAQTLREAFESGNFDRPPRLLLSAFPTGLFEPIFVSLKKKKGPPLVANPPGGVLGIEREQASLLVDIRPFRDRKVASVWAHRSQLLNDDPFTFLMPGFLWKLLDEEWFIHAAGPPLPVDARSPLDGL